MKKSVEMTKRKSKQLFRFKLGLGIDETGFNLLFWLSLNPEICFLFYWFVAVYIF